MPSHCKKCNTTRKVYTFRNSSFFSAILIILLPKCPFCIMAYSSAITICGGQDIYLSSNNWISFIPLALAVVVFSMIVLNRKGRRTWIAAIVALISAFLIVLSHQLIISASYYNIGGVGLLIAAWINGNLVAFTHHLARKLRTGSRRGKRPITYSIDQK